MKKIRIKYGRDLRLLLLCCVLFLLLAVLAVAGKKNLHEDEVYTYGLSNHRGGINFEPELGRKYEDAAQPYREYMATQPDGRLDYRHVWGKQCADVHPPFYYYLVHTICSFFMDTYSVWFAAVINLGSSVVTILLLYRITCLLGQRRLALTVCFFFAVSPGILQMNTFLRMYVMTMMWICAVTWWHLAFAQGDAAGEKEDGRNRLPVYFYLGLIVLAVLGALTHYYFLVFLFFQCLCFGCHLLYRKRFGDAVKYALSLGTAGLVCYWHFPTMVRHIFHGYRGMDSINRLKEATGYPHKLFIFWNFMDSVLFGGFLAVILLGVLIAAVCHVWMKKHGKQTDSLFWEKKRICRILVTVPAACYFLLVSKAAVMEEERYVSPVYGLAIVIGICLSAGLAERITDKMGMGERRKKMVYGICLLVFLTAGYIRCPWYYSFRESIPALEAAEKYSENDCIFIASTDIEGNMFRCHRSFYEVSKYRSLTFIPKEDLSMLAEKGYNGYDHMVVYIINKTDREAVLAEILELCPNLTEYTKISEFGQAAGYYLE